MHYHKYRLIIPFVLPTLLLYGVFVLWPYAQSFYFSLTSWRGFTANRPFAGLDNFARLATDDLFWNALRHNLLLLLVLPVVTISIALLLSALLVHSGQQVRQGVAGASFYRIVYFFPQVMSAVVLGVLWSFVFHPSIGLLNGFLRSVGLGWMERTWLGDPAWVLWAIAAVSIWSSIGFFVVLFVAGMQAIPIDLYEAAKLDGASAWSSFRGITLPLLRNQTQVALVFVGLGALDMFALVQVMTKAGGPDRAADVVARYMYSLAFERSLFGYATAVGIVLLLLSLALSMITIRLTGRERIEF